MNKTQIACSILCLLGVSGVANATNILKSETSSIDLGGRFEARAEHSDSDIYDLSRARLKIQGITQLSDSMSGIGYFEQEFTSKVQKTRYLYTGVKAALGDGNATIIYGKTNGAMSVVTDITDIQAAYGAVAADKLKVGKRIENSIAINYENNSGTLFSANYAGSAGKVVGDFDSGFSVAGAQIIADTGLIAAIGYAKQNKVGKQGEDQFDVGLGYEVSAFYVGALYTEQTVSGKNGNGYDIVAAYQVNSTYKTTIGFGELDFKGGDSIRAVNADITARWNKQFRTYAAINYDIVKNEAQQRIGIRYDF